MSQKKPEHVIEYILRKTERKWSREHWKNKKYVKVEYSIDNTVYFCQICKQVWSYVPHYVDVRRRVKYPVGNMPTIGKKRKRCEECKEMSSEKQS